MARLCVTALWCAAVVAVAGCESGSSRGNESEKKKKSAASERKDSRLLGKRPEDVWTSELVPEYLGLLESRDQQERSEAIRWLKNHTDRQTIGALRQVANNRSESSSIRREAREAIVFIEKFDKSD